MPMSKQKKGHDGGGPPIALGALKLEGHRGIFPTSLYGQSAPAHILIHPKKHKFCFYIVAKI
jgi:hypothetical protein